MCLLEFKLIESGFYSWNKTNVERELFQIAVHRDGVWICSASDLY